jgi:hypothetical protein
MLSRGICRGATASRALSRRQAYGIVRRGTACRSVTTDAASSHAEKEDVPEVSIARLCGLRGNWKCRQEH